MKASGAAIVIPTHDRLGFLKQAIESAMAQTLKPVEIVVIDDASTDETWRWLSTLSDEQIRPVHLDENVGLNRARNLALRQVTSEYVLFLDDDDRLLRNALTSLVGAFEEYPDASFVAGAKIAFDDRGHRKRLRHPRRLMRSDIRKELLCGFTLVPSQLLFRTGALVDAGGWNETLDPGSDRELTLRLSRYATPVLISQSVTAYRRHPMQASLDVKDAFRRAYLLEYVASLPKVESDCLSRVLAARLSWEDGEAAFRAEDYSKAAAAHLAALRSAPRMALSRLVGPALCWGLIKSVAAMFLGRWVVLLIRNTKRIVRVKLRRDPEGRSV